MNTTQTFTKTLPVVEQLLRVLAVLCCLGALASCNKEESSVPPTTSRKDSPVKNAHPPINVGLSFHLDDVAHQLKEKGGDWETRNQAIKIVMQIGEQRQTEAIPSLLNGMLVVQPFSINNALDYADTYPCSAALVKIGEPAVPQIEARILATGTNIEQMVLLDTLRQIRGSEKVTQWLESLPDKGVGSLPAQRLTELKQWALSQTP
jgi:hypothetical protein